MMQRAAQLVAGVVAAATPWCVVRIALAVAGRHARSVQRPFAAPRAVRAVDSLTTLVIPLVAALALWLPAPSLLMAAVDIVAFGGLSIVALRALSRIQDVSRPAREAVSPVRDAALHPRRVGQYVAPGWRVALLVLTIAALAIFGWRVMSPAPHRRLLVPVAFAAFAPVFLWLYDMWLRQVTFGGQTADAGNADARRRSSARMVFHIETVLVCGYLVLAHAMLDVDWQLHGLRAAAGLIAGAVLGVTGCALAVSSSLAHREYRRV